MASFETIFLSVVSGAAVGNTVYSLARGEVTIGAIEAGVATCTILAALHTMVDVDDQASIQPKRGAPPKTISQSRFEG